MIKLSDLNVGERAKIVKYFERNNVSQRLWQLGLTTGQVVEMLSISSLKKCFLISVRNCVVAISKRNIELIGVEKL